MMRQLLYRPSRLHHSWKLWEVRGSELLPSRTQSHVAILHCRGRKLQLRMHVHSSRSSFSPFQVYISRIETRLEVDRQPATVLVSHSGFSSCRGPWTNMRAVRLSTWRAWAKRVPPLAAEFTGHAMEQITAILECGRPRSK